MRCSLVSHSDAGGGAAIAMYRLHEELRALGVSSEVLVAQKRSSDGNISQVSRVPKGIFERIDKKLTTSRIERERRCALANRNRSLELFSDDRVIGPDGLSENLPEADVYHLHWVAGIVDYRRFFVALGPERPLVWTLHDMNPFTGGCHYTLGCDRFIGHCGTCPQLGSSDNQDLSYRIHARKTAAMAARRPAKTRIIAPSHWLAEEARRSTLFNRFDVEVVPNGIDCDTFQPRDKVLGRDVFGLPQDRPVLLFAADSVTNHRKGFDLLLEALRDLPEDLGVTLAAVGHLDKGADLPGDVVSLGRIESERLMSFAYSAADAFVMPTRADNLPNVVLEAMACGTPVVSFDVGGLPDMVVPGETGLLAPPENVEGLRNCLVQMLSDPEASRAMGKRARYRIVQEFDGETIARRYMAVYESVLSGGKNANDFRH